MNDQIWLMILVPLAVAVVVSTLNVLAQGMLFEAVREWFRSKGAPR